ncbi:Mechanosensory protein 2 [Papilio xuthus]|uniref:Mechanosensory protein 2 n=1 Tax=Papilio xuthus TaxID=66420 RepID=A0A194Q812_PAPXU|nr:Mechanosensory protein 2 [Papilio xuthus]
MRYTLRGVKYSMDFGCYDKDSGEVECYLEIPNPEAVGCVERFATFLSFLLVIITFPFSLFECFKVVQEFERAVIFRLGRVRKGGARGPGLFFVLPCVDTYRKVDLRTVSFDVPPQEVLTRDSVTVAVDAVVYYRIKEPLNAVVRVADYSASTRLLAATTLRNVLGMRDLAQLLSDREAISHMMQANLDEATDPWGVEVERVEIASTRLLAATTLRNVLGMRDLAQLLSDREAISHMMQANLDEATDPWGVEVERVEIKDVRLPVQLQRAMAAEAETDREARAKIIAAEGEIKASKALKEASLVMIDNPMALQLRYLQSLNTISAEKNSTIIFPFPMDFLRTFLGGAGPSMSPSLPI